MELLTPEVFAACREYLPFEKVDELQGMYAALQEESSVVEQRQLRRLSREYLERGGLVASRQETAATLLRNAEALERIAEDSRRQAASEARELRVEVRRARDGARERTNAAEETRAKFERAAWPALEAGGRIALAESKLRTIELADALTSDWEAFAALKEGEEIEAPGDSKALAASAERVGLLLEIAGGAARGEETERTTAAIERHAQQVEGRLVEQLLFAAALRRDDEMESSGFRSRNEAGMVAAAEALDKLHQHLKPFLHDAWRDAVVARVATVSMGRRSSNSRSQDEEPLAKFQSAIKAARKVVCGKDGELCAALRVFMKTERGRELRVADLRDTTRKLARGLVEELGLRQAVLEVLAAADYADADYFDDDDDGSNANLPPTNYLDALARLASMVNGLHRALDRAVDCALGIVTAANTRRRRRDPTQDSLRSLSSSEGEDDEVAADQHEEIAAGDPRRSLSEAAKGEIASATEILLEAARRDYARREYDCLEAALVASGRELANAATAGTATSVENGGGSGSGFLFGRRKQSQSVAGEGDEEGESAAVPADASLSALLRGPLRPDDLESAEDALAKSLARCSAVLPPVAICDEDDDNNCGAHTLTQSAVVAVLEKSGDTVEYHRSSRRKSSLLGANSTAEDVSRELVRRARRFTYDRLLRPAVRVAKARLEEIESRRPAVAENYNRFLFGGQTSANSKHWLEEDEKQGPPRAFFDVIVAALDAEARWRRIEAGVLTGDVEMREGASASLRVDIGDALRLAVKVFAGLVRFKLLSSGGREDQPMYAMKSEPEKLQPTRAVSEACRSLKVHVQTVAAIMRVQPTRAADTELDRAQEIAAMLAARWRLALAHEVFAGFEDRVGKMKVTPAGAFVLSRDVDELRNAVASLGCVTTDAAFLELREDCSLLKLDREDLRRLLLSDPSDTFAQDKSRLAKVIDMRADAWNARTTKRLPWVDDLFHELSLLPGTRYVT